MRLRRHLAVLTIVAAGCSAQAAPAPTAPSTTARSTTTVTSTTAATTTTTTTVPATTIAATLPATTETTAVPLPVPVAAPPEDGTPEPAVDLGTIEIPAIGLSRTMGEGIRLSTLDRGPGHWPGTAMPGQVGNVVVAGHRVSHQADFRHLDQLVPGDEVVLTTADGRFVYAVTATEIVGPDAIWIVDQTAERTATLFACHPPGSVRERIVVHLALVA